MATQTDNNPRNYSPIELLDNETLVIAMDNWVEVQGRVKQNERQLNIVKAAIIDSENLIHGHSSPIKTEFDFLKDDYASIEEFNEECIPLYTQVCNFYKLLTPRQAVILQHFLIDKLTISDISRKYNISKAGVLKTMSLIRKKAHKSKIIF